MLGRKGKEGQHVGIGLFEHGGDLRHPALELADGVAQAPAGSSASGAVKIERMSAPSASCWSRRTCPRRSLRKCTVQRWPRRAEDLPERGLQARMGVADGELDADQAARDRASEELAPERLDLRRRRRPGR
jgi:hypothetical protein